MVTLVSSLAKSLAGYSRVAKFCLLYLDAYFVWQVFCLIKLNYQKKSLAGDDLVQVVDLTKLDCVFFLVSGPRNIILIYD